MDNIDLFDKYIKGELSEKERHEFDTRLKTDKDFASDFRVYSATVIGICREARQDNKDFEMAMKNISKEKLLEIIGKTDEDNAEYPAAASVEMHPAAAPVAIKPYKNPLKAWAWAAACSAIVIGGASIWMIKSQQSARYVASDAVYSLSYAYEEGPSRGATTNIPDLNSLSDGELKDLLPGLESEFNECDNPEDTYQIGYPLAMAYIRLHQLDKARQVLNRMIETLSQDDDYSEETAKLKTILNLLD